MSLIIAEYYGFRQIFLASDTPKDVNYKILLRSFLLKCLSFEDGMKEGIHPKYHKVLVSCACGNKFETRSTKPEIRLELCSACHPFFTGKQKLIDTAGRIERFQKRYGLDKPANNEDGV